MKYLGRCRSTLQFIKVPKRLSLVSIILRPRLDIRTITITLSRGQHFLNIIFLLLIRQFHQCSIFWQVVEVRRGFAGTKHGVRCNTNVAFEFAQAFPETEAEDFGGD